MKVLFEKPQIENRIKEIGVQILNRHKEETTPIVLIGVLNGGFMFYSKLVDQLALLDPQCDFIRVKSYKGREHEVPEIIIPSSLSVKNKFVYIITYFCQRVTLFLKLFLLFFYGMSSTSYNS